ncbi:putative Tetratricopeptide repeat (TPR)-like superfamily protein [Hibiscus syriacus]|uniref:Tetratricopeptide repeat (TPR)-like superfamily protein n=1 Tax=Hibiscus syriacus TaxID=106335 RepID=A0A6A2XN89_HIBSY|nr:putative Tetratricopeptide repeat (TPR)-like superfamily protein [Hibiscus syriacus]
MAPTSKPEAARAYDAAAREFRGAKAKTNFTYGNTDDFTRSPARAAPWSLFSAAVGPHTLQRALSLPVTANRPTFFFDVFASAGKFISDAGGAQSESDSSSWVVDLYQGVRARVFDLDLNELPAEMF